MKDSIFTMLGVITGLLMMFSFIGGVKVGEKTHREEAIKAGVAYYTNNAAGESVFKWKECK